MIKWGIIGAGNMARHFANAIQEIDNAKLVAISSKNKKNLKNFSEEYRIDSKLRFSEYNKIGACNEVDAIYISTLNNTHFDLIKMCASNKKNILCEKPFCLNLSEASDLKKIIDKNNIKFFEAIAYLSHPQTNKILELVDSGEIGEVNSIESSFGFKVRKVNPNSRLFNKELGGGAILDVGCYPLSFISLFNDNQNSLKFKSLSRKICKTKVDIAASANIIINNKINCKIEVSLQENLKNKSIIYGSKGHLIVRSPWLPERKTFLEIFTRNRSYITFTNSDLSVYANQIKNISNEFLGKNDNKLKLFNISGSLENMKCLDYWMKAI
jgi:predicted dehydrogenase